MTEKLLTGTLSLNTTNQIIDPNIQPVTQPPRRIPFHLRKQVEAELKQLQDFDIIERVEGPTDWVSPIVVAPRPKPKSKTNEI